MATFRAGSFVIELVDDPANSLDDAKQQELIPQCMVVARNAFENPEVTEKDIINHAIKVPMAIYVREVKGPNDKGLIVAFSSALRERAEAQDILYLEGAVVEPGYQQKGIYSLVVALRILQAMKGRDPAGWLLATRTQTPLVFRMMLGYGLHPRLEEPVPDEMKLVAGAFAEIVSREYSEFRSKYGFRFDHDTLVVRRAYGRIDPQSGEERGFCMNPNVRPCDENRGSEEDRKRHRLINEFFKDRSRIDVQDGDAVMLIGSLSLDAAFGKLDEALKKINPDRPEDNDAIKKHFA